MTETAKLLDALDALLGRYVAFPSEHDRHAVAAWAAHCWVVGVFDSTPRLALASPEKGSGKTRTLEVLEHVVPGPRHTVNMSAAVLFRLVGNEEEPCTLLMDEADTYLGWKVARDNEDIRGLVNAGHRRGAKAYRMKMEGGATVQTFPAFAPVALACIGDLPDTILDRSIVVAMKRRAPSEYIESFRLRHAERETLPLREGLEGWAERTSDDLEGILDVLAMPDGIEDRAADVWEALVAIGDLAGDPWAEWLRTAAVELNGRRAERDPSLGVQLLRDVRGIFDHIDVDRISSRDLAEALADIEGAPWADLRGHPIDANGIAKRLRPYEVRPRTHRFGDETHRGYLAEDFFDVWNRYLPPAEPRNTHHNRNNEEPTDVPTLDVVTSVTPVTGSPEGDDYRCLGCATPIDLPYWCDPCAAQGDRIPA